MRGSATITDSLPFRKHRTAQLNSDVKSGDERLPVFGKMLCGSRRSRHGALEVPGIDPPEEPGLHRPGEPSSRYAMPLLPFGLEIADLSSEVRSGRDHTRVNHPLKTSADVTGVSRLPEADHAEACGSTPFSAARLNQPRRRPGGRPPPAAAG